MNEALKKAIEESGNRLHLRVANLLVKEGWTVQLSPYYVDELTATPREIDIIASRRVSVNNTFGNEKDHFWIHLVIECKRLTKATAFYEFRNQRPFDPIDAIRKGDLNRSEIIDNMSFAQNHHYVQRSSTARLYELERGETASATDEVYKSITQAVKALIFQEYGFKGRPEGRALYYPVVIYNGIDGIWSLAGSPEPNVEASELKKTSLYALQYAYRDMGNSNIRKEWFIVDFVHENALPKLLEDIAKDRKGLIGGMEFRLRL